jgi:hypothetical protein
MVEEVVLDVSDLNDVDVEEAAEDPLVQTGTK